MSVDAVVKRVRWAKMLRVIRASRPPSRAMGQEVMARA